MRELVSRSSDQPPALLSVTSPTSKKSTGASWEESGFGFIPIRRAHLDYLAFSYGEDAVPISQCIGRTMVDRQLIPLGFSLAWFRPEGSVTIHAHFGKWLKIYPTYIIRAMRQTADEVRARGVKEVWMIADERIEGSDKMCAWVGAEKSDQYVDGNGWYWKLDLAGKSKI
jgi:hypothetical protein